MGEALEAWTPQTLFLGIIGTYCNDDEVTKVPRPSMPVSFPSDELPSHDLHHGPLLTVQAEAPQRPTDGRAPEQEAIRGGESGTSEAAAVIPFRGGAVASKGPLALEGEYLWKLKDRIDRQWMDGYQTLPDMEEMMKKKVLKLYTTMICTTSDRNLLYVLCVFTVMWTCELHPWCGRQEQQLANAPRPSAIPSVAQHMGQEAIDMLSKAKMR